MSNLLEFTQIELGKYECKLDLSTLYSSHKERDKFELNWIDFLASDKANPRVFARQGDIILYPHKSWIPEKSGNRKSVFIIGGNPAPHSVLADTYYAYEGKGTVHRFWRVLQELGFINFAEVEQSEMKRKFFSLDYESPFRFAMEAIFTFPSTPSAPKWSGVMGLEKLFGRRALYVIYEVEKLRVHGQIKNFLKKDGAIIAMQKDAYNVLANNKYDVKKATTAELKSKFNDYPLYGTPPTRWLYTNKMKACLLKIKEEILSL